MAQHCVAWCGVAWLGVAWRGVAWRSVILDYKNIYSKSASLTPHGGLRIVARLRSSRRHSVMSFSKLFVSREAR